MSSLHVLDEHPRILLVPPSQQQLASTQINILITNNTMQLILPLSNTSFICTSHAPVPVKSTLYQDSVQYLGHHIDCFGIHTLPSKVAAVTDAPKPRNVSKLRYFLGMLNYYAKFIPNLCSHCTSYSRKDNSGFGRRNVVRHFRSLKRAYHSACTGSL